MLPMLIGPIASLVGDVIKRVLPAEKMSEADRAELTAKIQTELLKADWLLYKSRQM